jgi:hypothetical protein
MHRRFIILINNKFGNFLSKQNLDCFVKRPNHITPVNRLCPNKQNHAFAVFVIPVPDQVRDDGPVVRQAVRKAHGPEQSRMIHHPERSRRGIRFFSKSYATGCRIKSGMTDTNKRFFEIRHNLGLRSGVRRSDGN